MSVPGPASTLPPTEALPLMREWLELMGSGIVFLNADGRITFANHAADQIFCRPGERLKGKTRRFCERRGLFSSEYLGRLAEATDQTVYFLAHADEREVRVDKVAKHIRGTYNPVVVLGKYQGVLATYVDVTKEHEAARLRDDLMQMMFHDMQHPLSAIMLNLDGLLLLDDGALSDAQQEFIETAKHNVMRLHAMFTNMVEIGKIEAGELRLARKTFDMNALVESVLRDQFSLRFDAANKRLTLSASAHLPPVTGDPNLLSRVLTNLVDNALKFTKEGGTVEVRTARGRDRRSVRVAVRDQGPGVPAEFAQVIFEKYRQVHMQRRGIKAGAGLGLAFCKLAVEAHGGAVWVRPAPGGGSEFGFRIPCTPADGDS